ncbi:hypothetical protein COV17_00760 [Candidatus Woesearchaeota archaeon CG10_big_fil_rev_8_21_14_0_10_36_11]|nr:MAG: hypothetical protein COV17_00760 [Candidatus Woesearchaeota archaeon CG10_big_fil_rev_8_21_14_0_10_36_11]
MSSTKSKAKLFFYAILLVILLFGFLSVFIPFSGTMFTLELVGFVALVVLGFAGFVGYSAQWGERVLFCVFLLYIINFLLIWFFTDLLYMILLIAALVGFLLSVPKKETKELEKKEKSSSQQQKPKKELPVKEQEPHSMVFDVPPPQKITGTPKSKTEYSPGKFVASKNGKVYHVPKCEWAKRIAKGSYVWFTKKEDAWEKGYRAHSCIE